MKKQVIVLTALLLAMLLLAGCLAGENTERFSVKPLRESQTDKTADPVQRSGSLPPEADSSVVPSDDELPGESTVPATEPSVSEPAVTEPAETEPPVPEPPEPEPPATEPSETDAPSTEPPERTATEPGEEDEVTYIANTNSKKFHHPWCSSVDSMKESNKWYFTGTREELIEYGYDPCQRCKP